MLPTFPAIITEREQMNADMIRAFVKAKAPMLADLPGHIVHEGRSTAIARADGAVEPTEMVKHSATLEVSRMKVGTFIKQHNQLLDEIADQFAESQSRQVIEVLTEGTEKAGNVVDGKGRPFSDDLLYETLEKMHHSFGPDGQWQAPTMVVGPELYEKIQKYEQNRTPEQRALFNKRLAKLIELKRADYASEQAGRILAG